MVRRIEGKSRARHREREVYLESGQLSSGVRSVVAESWIRSAAAGVDPVAFRLEHLSNPRMRVVLLAAVCLGSVRLFQIRNRLDLFE